MVYTSIMDHYGICICFTRVLGRLVILERIRRISFPFLAGAFFRQVVKDSTPWKFNIAPENKPSQKESNLQTIILQGLC